eukprot:862374-Prymnesium_polylepis.1
MPAAVSQPLSSSARPYEAGWARGRTRRTTWRRSACATFLLVRERLIYRVRCDHGGGQTWVVGLRTNPKKGRCRMTFTYPTHIHQPLNIIFDPVGHVLPKHRFWTLSGFWSRAARG